jgi:hypothetical protein
MPAGDCFDVYGGSTAHPMSYVPLNSTISIEDAQGLTFHVPILSPALSLEDFVTRVHQLAEPPPLIALA